MNELPIIKYPRTPHLEGSQLQPGDEDLRQAPFRAIAGRYITDGHIDHLRQDARQLGLDEDRQCRETDGTNAMEGLYIKVEENGEVVDRVKFVRRSFKQAVDNAQGHWLERPIVPNRLCRSVEDLFRPTLN